jgi:uncharacterized protein (TIGR03085 family)
VKIVNRQIESRSYAREERTALADLMDELGPEAPTLCGDWTTYDLAAHLVARERRLDSAPGIVLPFLSGWTERVRRGLRAQHTYAELVELVRSGPPGWSPFSLRAIDDSTNTQEFYVHHEDVRRAREDWGPRAVPSGLEKTLWNRLRATGRLAVRSSPCGLTLVTPDDRRAVILARRPMVTLSGPPSELVLFCLGRQAVARVDVDPGGHSGEPDDEPASEEILAKLQVAKFGI